MQEKEVLVWLRYLPVAIALTGFTMMILIAGGRPGKKVLKLCEDLKGFLKQEGENTTWYARKKEWLSKKGVGFHFGTWVTALSWLTLCLLLSFAGLYAGICISAWCAVPMAVGFYQLPGILAWFLNNRDNEKMLPEIKLIYHALEIQIRAGVYVTDALTECYAGVQDRRLKQALLDLAGDIAMKADIVDALEYFQDRFDNRYIDALCITILQALESGQAVELLGDIAEQVKDMEVAVMTRKKGSLDRSVTFYQLGILAAVLGIVLYACITQMFVTALTF